ncbi:MAG TPA: zf-HC2 domain-containing protein [Pseudonocardiaceae bacterium]|nr:zf-HC2 domain-containing protein [Pseudonocardiaceae bacterium]
MDCTQCKEALSARLDGEDSEAERDAVDEHVAICPGCHRFADDAARVTRLARTEIASLEPDVVDAVLAAAPRSRRPQLIAAVRVLLAVVGLAQAGVALVGIIGAHSSEHSGVVLQGASVAHFAHESAAWNLALGVGFLWVAWRSSRPSGMVPTVATFVAVLTVLVVMDAMAGGVDAARLLTHGLVVLGLILVIVLDRLPGPAGGTVPGTPAWRQRRSPRSGSAEPASRTTAGGLPPDLRPTARLDDTAVAHRRTA